MNVYLDIDGVILANENNAANHAAEFIRAVVTRYPTYWLTTHCNGDAGVPIQRIGHLFDQDTLNLLKKIKPTSWKIAKTEAIDFSQPFLWFDDDLYPEERDDLAKHNALANIIKIDLQHDPDALLHFIELYTTN